MCPMLHVHLALDLVVTGPFFFILIQCVASSTPSSNHLSTVSKIDYGDDLC